LIRALVRRGARVEEVALYETRPATPPPSSIKKEILNGVDAVTFTSASTARHFRSFFSEREFRSVFKKAAAFSIGPTTTEILIKLGVRPVRQSRRATLPDLVSILIRFLGLKNAS
jgi:uroporphyrinogen-III synthase